MFNNYQERQKDLVDSFREREGTKRWEVHINSLHYDELKRLSLESFKQMENQQVLRALTLLSPNVSAVVVVPFDLSPDFMDYYYKLL